MAISCDPSDLANAARCFDNCARGGIGQAVKSYLLCQYANLPVGPAAPTNPDIADASIFTDVIFTWTNPSPAGTSNQIFKSTNGGPFVLYSTVAGNVSSFHDPLALAGTAFWTYKVRTISAAGTSAFTDTRSVCYTINKALAADVSANLTDLVMVLNDPNDGAGGLLYNNMPNLASFSAPLLRRCDGNLLLNDCPNLASVNLPLVVSVGQTSSCSFMLDNCTSLPTLSLPQTQFIGGNGGNFHLSNCTALTSVSFPALISIGGEILFNSTTSLASIACPSLTSIAESLNGTSSGIASASFPVLQTIGTDVNFSSCVHLTTLTLTVLNNVQGSFFMTGCPLITTLNLANLVQVAGDIQLGSCNALSNVNLPVIVFTDGAVIGFAADLLVVGSVNQILARGVASGTTTSDYELAGGPGTNAPPAGQGLLDKATLIGLGNTVNTN